MQVKYFSEGLILAAISIIMPGTLLGPLIYFVGHLSGISLIQWIGAVYGMLGWGVLCLGISAMPAAALQEWLAPHIGKPASMVAFWIVFLFFAAAFLGGPAEVVISQSWVGMLD